MIEETLGSYRFRLNSKALVIETSRSVFQKASLYDVGWVVDDTGEIFKTLRELWEYMSSCIRDVRSLLWAKERCDEYYVFIDGVFRGFISELEKVINLPEVK